MFANIKRWTLIRRTGATIYQLRYTMSDGTIRERSTKESSKRNATKVAMQILKVANELGEREIYGWIEFCERYEIEHLGNRPRKSVQAFQTASHRLSHLVPSVNFVSDITAKVLVTFATRLRAENKSEATIQAYRDHIMASLRWAVDMDLIAKRPTAPRLSRVPSGSKGRALTDPEFELLIAALPEAVGEDYADQWAWNLRGAWLSGLRLGEFCNIYWEPQFDSHYIVGIDTARPKMHISAAAEKAYRDRELPLTPDFVSFLRGVDPALRSGRVFRFPLASGETRNTHTIGRRISKAGEISGVRVSRTKYCSCHDLRRSFGSRWATKVQPFVLKTLMRHSSITTTERYYVSIRSDSVADALYPAANSG